MKVNLTQGGRQLSADELSALLSLDAQESQEGMYKSLSSSKSAGLHRDAKNNRAVGVEKRSLFADAEHLKAMDKIHAWVCVRERTRKECYKRLVEIEFEPRVASHAVERAVECGLIDEVRYTSAYIKGKVRAGWGRGRIVRSLEENGISQETIAECSEFFATPYEEYERALKEIDKRPARSKNPKATYVRRLLQKGYSQDIALRAVNEYLYGANAR